MKITQVTLWSNGMLMVFGDDGQQVPEYQGRAIEHLAPLLAAAPETCRWQIGDWRNGVVDTTRECLASFAAQFGAPCIADAAAAVL